MELWPWVQNCFLRLKQSQLTPILPLLLVIPLPRFLSDFANSLISKSKNQGYLSWKERPRNRPFWHCLCWLMGTHWKISLHIIPFVLDYSTQLIREVCIQTLAILLVQWPHDESLKSEYLIRFLLPNFQSESKPLKWNIFILSYFASRTNVFSTKSSKPVYSKSKSLSTSQFPKFSRMYKKILVTAPRNILTQAHIQRDNFAM